MRNKITSLDRCLHPLLKSLKWDGDERALFESMPHATTVDTLQQFRWVMQNLGFDSKLMSLNLKNADPRIFPCLFISAKTGSPEVIVEKNEKGLLVFNGTTEQITTLTTWDDEGVLISFKKQDESKQKDIQQHWFRTILFSEKKLLLWVSFLTLLQTLMLVVPSFYVINIYDRVIASDSYQMLFSFFIGIVIILVSLTLIMIMRTRFLGYIGIRIQKSVGNAIFKQLLKLPPYYTENASVPMQMMRLNDFHAVRNFFSGSLFTTLLEFPFLTIYFLIVWAIGGVLVVIPLVAMFIAFAIAGITWRVTQHSIRESTSSSSEYKDFLLESFWGMRSLQYAGLQEKWMSRFRDISAKADYYGKKLLFSSQANDIIFDMLTLLAGLATLVVGTLMVIKNNLQLGALIGVMFIIWRILTPIRSINTMIPKLMQLKISSKQINDLMKLPVELPSERQWKNTPQYIVGSIEFAQVTFRYPNTDSPALKNISFTLKTGQTMLIIGPSASGKSTMANLILAIYSPQAGHIFIDGRNIKQYDVNVLRKNIAYVPQKTELFYGTIAQNIALSQPLASQEQIIEAAKTANLLQEANALPDGLNTRIRFYSDEKLGPAFCQKINLARAYLRNAPILIMDEPTGTLDAESIDAFENFLMKIKGKKTVLIFGHNTRFMPLVDQGMLLYDGYIVASGDPKTVMESLPQGMV